MKFNLLLPEENKIITYDDETISRSEILDLCSKGKYYDISFNNFLNEHKIEMKVKLSNIWPALNNSLPLFTYDLITPERLKLFLSLFDKIDRLPENDIDIENADEFKFFSIHNDEDTIAEIKRFIRRIENSFTTTDTATLKEIPNPKEFVKIAKNFVEIMADPYFLEERSKGCSVLFTVMDSFIKITFVLAVCSKLAKIYPYIEEIRVEDIAVDYNVYDDDMYEEEEEEEEDSNTYTEKFKIESKEQAMEILNMLEKYKDFNKDKPLDI